MALSDEVIRSCTRRLLLSRMRLMCNHGFYGLLLMHLQYSIDEKVETACTDGKRIIFGPHFLLELTDGEVDFVMMHELLHVVLRHCKRGIGLEKERFNVACDIVVNSNILQENKMNLNSITLKQYGLSMHLAPNGREGYEYTAEEVYDMLNPNLFSNKNKKKSGPGGSFQDDHSRWQEESESEDEDDYDEFQDVWEKRVLDAVEVIENREKAGGNPGYGYGGLPIFAERMLRELKSEQINWRTILNEFIQEEISDYSFSPPDRRFDDSPFFLPDFNEKDESVKGVWFVVDTSGSISGKMIAAAYGEICSAIEQFNGKLEGMLSFTESYVTDPIPFSSVFDIMQIVPVGGGGNDFSDIFRYMNQKMYSNMPTQIIIITDGYDNFPDEKEASGIPVLWLINNEKVTPPWGKVARIKV